MADLNQPIEGRTQGAYQTMVKLSDGSIVSLADYWKNVNGRTIVARLQGAYASQSSKADNSIVDTVADIKATGGKSVVVEIKGAYNERVLVDGQLVSLASKIANDAN